MAGMLVPGLGFAPDGLWAAVFVVTGCWFGVHAARGVSRGRSAGAGHPATGPFVHVLACGAMLVMLAAPASRASAMTAGEGGSAGALPVLAVVCAVGLLASVVLAADRLTVLARVPAVGTAGPGGTAGVPMSPRLAAGCDIAVGVTMGYLLVLMIA
jgi:hypothetical protein